MPLKSPAKNALSPQNNSQKMSLFSVQWKSRFIQCLKSSWSPGALGCTLLSHYPEHKQITSGWVKWGNGCLLRWLMCVSICLCNHFILACTMMSSEINSETKRTAVDLSTRSSLMMVGSVSVRPIKRQFLLLPQRKSNHPLQNMRKQLARQLWQGMTWNGKLHGCWNLKGSVHQNYKKMYLIYL